MQLTKTQITLVVLSSEPIPDDMELAGILREGYDGSYVIDVSLVEAETLTADEMRTALVTAGNDGTFFDDEIGDDGGD